MKKTKTLSVLVVFILMEGCGNPVTQISVTKPTPTPNQNNPIDPITVNAGVGPTWDRVLSNAMNSSFKIKKVDSISHIVSLTISGKPSLYIDCGTKTIDTDGDVNQVVNTNGQYTYTVYRNNHIDTYSVENNFNGKTVIFVSGDTETSVIQVKTELELISNQQMSTTQGSFHGNSERYRLNITGNERKLFDGFGATSTCQSTGNFEKEVRALLLL